jgi:hypothetical protein
MSTEQIICIIKAIKNFQQADKRRTNFPMYRNEFDRLNAVVRVEPNRVIKNPSGDPTIFLLPIESTLEKLLTMTGFHEVDRGPKKRYHQFPQRLHLEQERL